MKKIILTLVLALSVAGCAQLGDAVKVATTTIVNPVDSVDIYRLKNTYAATLQIAVDWRAYCYSKPYSVLMADPIAKPLCQNRRSTVRAIQSAKAKAHSAVFDAQDFVSQNPTINASVVITAGWNAVKNFQAAVPAK